MKKFIIGITPRFLEHNDKEYVQVNQYYIDELVKRDTAPLIIVDSPNVQELLELCDAFLVIGGDDFDPLFYNQTNTGLSKGIKRNLDLLDQKIILYAEQSKKPLLGICRGHQALAALTGGSLYQDIKEAKLLHQEENDHMHLVHKVNNSPLANLLPDNFMVNSYHHQAIKDLPADYIVTFKCHDIIEAIEHKKLPIIGVQWHPERMTSNETKIIFDYFIDCICKK